MVEQAKYGFTMDDNLLVSVIKTQAGSLSKALLEGVMNSIDAGATRVDITLDHERFTIKDDGRGFSSKEEIKEYFGRFGTPHVEGDAVYGRFRMGRGQLFAFAATVWQSGEYQMTVDIENDGLEYGLKKLEQPVSGCLIEGRLYQRLSDWKYTETLQSLRKLVAYAPKPVYVNGEQYGKPASKCKWTYEDEDAYYLILQGADELQVYNLGVFVESRYASSMGAGGIVVSKKALKVNFARNSVLEDQCPIWQRISHHLEQLVMRKLSSAKALSETERKFLATRLSNLEAHPTLKWRELKLLTDPTGKHLALSALKKFKRFVHIDGEPHYAAAIHGSDGTFVVTDKLLNRFGVGSLNEWLARMERYDLVNPDYEVVEREQLAELDLGNAKTLDADGLTRRESAAFHTLIILNDMLVARLMPYTDIKKIRSLRIGAHKSNAVAWTDGQSYITANRKYLNKLFNEGVDGVYEWLLTLLHEYTHDTDDSESHSHGEVFYQKYHDLTFAAGKQFASLAREGLKIYLQQLKTRGVPRPRRLLKQLRD